MLNWKRIGLCAALVVGAGVSASAEVLSIGDPAPKLKVKEFIKGEPVKEFEQGKNYVVEFWATWCGPCRVSIPHLTELQKKHKDVTFIGVSVWEQDPHGIKPFVEEMGKKMDYRVAVDAVPAGKEPGDGAMAVAWMKAAEQNGIPTAFVINKEGKIAWIGHPMAMDKDLDKIVAGDWDIQVAREAKRKEVENQAKVGKLAAKLQAAQLAGKGPELLSTIEELTAIAPQAEPFLAPMKLKALVLCDRQDDALALGETIEKSSIGQSPQVLNNLAWTIIDPHSKAKPNAKLLEFALKVARSADEKAEGKIGPVADTLARAYFVNGQAAEAVSAQKRAIELTEKAGGRLDPSAKERLKEYEKAAEKK